MKVVDVMALENIYDAVCVGDNPVNKIVYAKLVLFRKNIEKFQLNDAVFNQVKELLKEFDFILDIKPNYYLKKCNFKLTDEEYLNVAEFIIKFKVPQSWFRFDIYYGFIDKIAKHNFSDGWVPSGCFVENNFLEVDLEESNEINVEQLFENNNTKNNTFKSSIPEFSSEEEKYAWLSQLKKSLFNDVAVNTSWTDVQIDKNILYKKVNDIKDFQGLYGIDSQIKMILTAILAAKETNGKRKAHTVLFGPAGCGKTTILDRLDDLLGKENVLRLDAPCMTKSGLETLLLEMKNIPPIIIIEEIEKSSENNLRTLLSIMDERSEICKTTVSGSITKSINSLIFSTVNDIEKFNKFLDGALSSRFKNKVFFPRPSHDVLWNILERDISKYGGKIEWIDPALAFAEELNISDPRMILSFLINGDRLLDGSFQHDYREMERLKKEAGYGD